MRKSSITRALVFTVLVFFALHMPSMAQKTTVVGSGVTNSTIQAAVNSAVNGDTIFISVGTFPEAVMVSNKNLNLVGGWNEAFDTWIGTPSVVDGLNTHRPLTILASSSTVQYLNLYDGGGGLGNSWGGGLNVGRTSWVHLASCIVQESESAWAGGGIYVSAESYARLVGCSVMNNRAYDGWAGLYGGSFGGGMFVGVSGSAEILNATVFSQNTATSGYGGGVWMNTGSLSISNSHFWGNEARAGASVATAHGGGLGAVASRVEIEDTLFEDNVAAFRGGGMGLSACTALIGQAKGVDFDGNIASVGGGMYLTNSRAILRDTSFDYNEALTNGGGISMDYSFLRMEGPLGGFFNNWAEEQGGAVQMLDSTASFDTVFFGFDGSGGNEAQYGGGISAGFSSLTISGGSFSANCATGNWPFVAGGAIYYYASAQSLCVTSGSGGVGIYGSYTQTVFNANHATRTSGIGGAVYVLADSKFYNALFMSNSAMEGGAVYLSYAPTNTFIRSTFHRNYAADRGGAIRSYSGVVYAVDSTFSENDTGPIGDGGALSMSGQRLDAYNCKFLNNTSAYGAAVSVWDAGVAIKGSGFLGDWYYRPYNPSNGYASLFQGNVASVGGALYSWGNTVDVEYTSFIANEAAAGSGAHVADLSSEINIYGSLLVDAGSGDALDLWGTPLCNVRMSTVANNAGAGVRLAGSANVGISNSIVWDGGDTIVQTLGTYSLGYSDVEGYPGATVISTNPWFLPNYHLRSESPCRNTGEPLVLPGPIFRIVYDIDGEVPMGPNNDIGFDQFLDTDGDSLPDIIETGTGEWKSEIDTGSSSNLVHSDGDGVPDGAEWVAYTDPSNPDSVFKIIKMWPNHDRMHIQWTSGTNSVIHSTYHGGEWNDGVWMATPYIGGGVMTNEADFGIGDSEFFYIGMER